MRLKTTVRMATVVVFFLIGVTLIPEFGSDLLEATGVKSSGILSRVFEGAFWYQLLVKAGNRTPRNKFVRIVELREHQGPDELFDNICKQRLLIAKLIQKLQIAEPSVIVIDKYFSPDSCRDPQDPGNRMLKKVISTTQTPLVLGVHTLDSDDLRLADPLSPAEERSLKQAGLVKAQALPFDNPKGLIDYGLIRLNHDNRKIPLEWRVFKSRFDLAASDHCPQPMATPDHCPQPMPTLSLVAARTADPDMASVSRLNSLFSTESHPYTGFLSEEEIKTFSALDLICGPNFPHPEDWEHCGSSDYGNEEIRHHVIIIGNKKANQDYHPSVIGDVPGVVLQANYIESLMDDRYLKPVSPWWNIGINLLAVFAIGCLFLLPFWQKHMGLFSLNAVAISASIVLVLWVLSYLIVVTLGYYMAIWFPGLYILALWAHTEIEEVEKEEKKIEVEAKVA